MENWPGRLLANPFVIEPRKELQEEPEQDDGQEGQDEDEDITDGINIQLAAALVPQKEQAIQIKNIYIGKRRI